MTNAVGEVSNEVSNEVRDRPAGAGGRLRRAALEALMIVAVGVACTVLAVVVGKTGIKGLIAMLAATGLIAALVLMKQRSKALMIGLVISLLVLQHKRLGPLYPSTESGALGMEVSSADVVVAVMYVVWALEGTMRRDLRRAFRQPVFWAPLLGMLAMTFSLFMAKSVYLGVSELFRLGWVYLLFLYFGARVRTRKEIGVVLCALGGFAVVELVVVLLQWQTGGVLGLSFLGVPNALTQRTLDIGAVGRPFGTIIHPVFLSDVLGMLALLAACLAVYLPSRKHKRLCLAVVPVCVVPIALASARGPGLALIITGILLGLVLVARHRLTRRTVVITLAVCVVAVAVGWPEVSKLIADNFGTHHLGVEIQARLQLNGVASRMIDSSPLLGVGLNNYTQVMSNFAPYPLLFPGFPAHNLFFLQTAETGLLGLFALLGIGASLFWVSARVSRSRDPLFAGLGTGMAAILVFTFIEEMLSYSLREEVPLAVFWMLAGLTVAARRIAYDERQGTAFEAPVKGTVRRHRRPSGRRPAGGTRRRRYERPAPRVHVERPRSRPAQPPLHRLRHLLSPSIAFASGAHRAALGRHAAGSTPPSGRSHGVRGRRPASVVVIAVAVGIMGVGGASAWAVADGTSSTPSPPVVGGQGPNLVFSAVSRTTGTHAIYSLDAGSTVPVQVTPNDGGYYSWPEWVLGGQKIIYTARYGAQGDAQNIVMANPDGSGAVQLTHADWRVDQPKVSPDGTKVLFAAFWPNYAEVSLYVLDLNTLEVTNVSAAHGVGPEFDSDPRWAANGQIVYSHSILTADGSTVTPPQIWLMNGDGSDPHALTADSYFDVDGDVSPNGQSVAYSSYQGPGRPTTGSGADEDPFDLKLTNWFVMVQGVGGGTAHAINGGEDCSLRPADNLCGPSEGVAANPQWSADGSRLAYITVRSALDICICSAAPDGSSPQVLFDSTQLAIDWFSWVVPSSAPPSSAVAQPGTEQSNDQFLWGTGGSGQGPTLAVSPDDLWGQSSLTLPSGLTPINARWSPDRTEIAFTANTPYNPDAATPTPAPPPGQVRHIHFTLSDLNEAFTPQASTNPDLADEQVFLLNPATGAVRQVTSPWTEDWEDALKPGEARANTDPSFSPDGKYLLVTNVSDLDGESFILRINLQTGAVFNLTNVTSGAVPVGDSQASYSPDGSEIAFSSAVGGQSQIFLMDADGTHVRQVTQDAFDDGSPAWSPDGQTLVYASYQGSMPLQAGSTSIDPSDLTGWALMRVDPANGTSSVVTTSNGGMIDPEYSPDGKSIAFLAMTSTAGLTPYIQPDIYVVSASGGTATARQPTPAVNELFFDWR